MSFVGANTELVAGVSNTMVNDLSGKHLRIISNADSFPAAASYLVRLENAKEGTVFESTIGFAPVSVLDCIGEAELSGLADGRYSLSVSVLDENGIVIGETGGDFGVGTAFEALRLEAENAAVGVNAGASTGGTGPEIITSTPENPAQIDNASNGGFVDFSGAGGDFNAGGGEWVEWTVNAPEAGAYDIAFGYAFNSGGADNRSMRLDVNGELFDRVFDFRDTGGNEIYSESSTRIMLAEGANTIRLTSNGFSGPNIDYLEVRPAAPASFTFQAEDLATGLNVAIDAETLSDGSDTYRLGAEGGAYLDWKGANETAQFGFEAPGAGTYEVRVTYANGGGGNRPLDLELVGDGVNQNLGTFSFAKTDGTAALRGIPDDVDDLPAGVKLSGEASLLAGWEGWSVETQTITLEAGGPTLLQLASNSRTTGPNIDRIEVVLVALDPVAPSAVALQNSSVLENDAGADIGALIVTDADGGDYIYAVDDARFEIVDGVLKLKAGEALDHEVDGGILSVNVTVTDDAGQVQNAVQFLIGDVNEAPVLAEGAALQDVQATSGNAQSIDLTALGATDQDAGQNPVYSARLASGDPLPAGVSVNGAALNIGADLAAGSFEIEVFATDGDLDSGLRLLHAHRCGTGGAIRDDLHSGRGTLHHR